MITEGVWMVSGVLELPLCLLALSSTFLRDRHFKHLQERFTLQGNSSSYAHKRYAEVE